MHDSHQSCIKILLMITLLVINFVLGILAYIIALRTIYQKTGKLTLVDFLANFPNIFIGILIIYYELIESDLASKAIISKKKEEK